MQKILGVLQIDQGLLEGIGGVPIGAGQTGDFHRVLGLRELQRAFRIDLRLLVFRAVEDILPALQQLVLGVDLLDRAGGLFVDEVLGHHDIARLSDGEVRFRGDDQPEAL